MFTALTMRPSVFRPPAIAGCYPRGSGVAASDTTFLALSSASGAANLPSTLTINGITVSPAARYEGASLTGTDGSLPGIAGPTLALASTGASYTSAFAPFTGTDASIAFGGGKYLAVTDTALDLGTDDFVIVMETTSSPTNTYSGKTASAALPSTGQPGWNVQVSSTLINLTIADASAQVQIAMSATTGARHLLVFCVDRSEASTNGGRGYINGALAGSANLSTAAGSLDNAAAFCLSKGGASGISFFAVYKRANWFAGGAQNATDMAAIAKEVAARFEGTYAATGLGSCVPLIKTRSSLAYIDRVVDDGTGERRLFMVSPNWTRLCRRKEIAGGEFFAGALLEAQSTNICLQSETFDNATWTKTDVTVTANALAAPDGNTTADAIVPSVAAGTHFALQAITLTAASHQFSVFAKMGAQRYLGLFLSVLSNGIMFDLQAGTVGTKFDSAANVVGKIENYGNGWYRCTAQFTGTAVSWNHQLFLSNADWANNATATNNFTGDGVTVGCYLFGAQVEVSPQDTNPSSYIATTTASVTRTQDTLQYDTSNGNYAVGPGQLSVDVMYPFSKAPAAGHELANASAGFSSIVDAVSLRTNTLTGTALAFENIGGAAEFSITGTSSNVDGEKHTLTNSWATNAGKLLVDGVQQGATDTSVTVLPAAPAALTLGMRTNSGLANALIGNVRLRNVAAS